MIAGIGIDLVSIERLRDSLERTPGLLQRLFHPNEQSLGISSLAARFAAKEALAKALGDPKLLSWIEIEVQTDEIGKPSLVLSGDSAKNLSARGIRISHLSLSHDAGVAAAVVVLEA